MEYRIRGASLVWVMARLVADRAESLKVRNVTAPQRSEIASLSAPAALKQVIIVSREKQMHMTLI